MLRRTRGPAVRLEAWWWTGPLGHLVAGLMDWVAALSRYGLHLARGRARRALGIGQTR